ncbi:femAB family protein [Synechococcus sp. BIOS-E4-1]|uniref:GNAT family N-acetyltransferase n=1 Tax=Synechococcus sp. BIOS-E4-1 TaxID=1400864 RepID=UPI001645EB38|nr:GNAT family N-acetyltransferase [Synechococcus sp. BIOS-E4-1]QNI52871.1 femAB family protein [Synechococcus sp. BIOS-E4-1]
MIQVTIIEGFGCNEFRDYILQNSCTFIYSEPRFLKLLAEHLGASSSWLVARRNGEIVGLLPFLKKDGPLGPVFNSLAYYGSNGGVIQVIQDDESKSLLVDSFYTLAAEEQASSATIITNPLELDSDFYDRKITYDYRDERIGLITHLPSSEDLLISRFDNPRPRNIRRAIKEGVTVAKGSTDALPFLYDIHSDNMRAIGGLAKKRSFFDAIPSTMHKDDWAVFTATLDGKPIAALLLFYFNETVEYFTPVIVETHRNTQALALVIYEAMRDAINLGFVNWNWGGTWTSQGGVYDFKKRWGTSEYRYYYYTCIYNSDLKTCRSEYILEHYPGFFLVPFNQLINPPIT